MILVAASAFFVLFVVYLRACATHLSLGRIALDPTAEHAVSMVLRAVAALTYANLGVHAFAEGLVLGDWLPAVAVLTGLGLAWRLARPRSAPASNPPLEQATRWFFGSLAAIGLAGLLAFALSCGLVASGWLESVRGLIPLTATWMLLLPAAQVFCLPIPRNRPTERPVETEPESERTTHRARAPRRRAAERLVYA